MEAGWARFPVMWCPLRRACVVLVSRVWCPRAARGFPRVARWGPSCRALGGLVARLGCPGVGGWCPVVLLALSLPLFFGRFLATDVLGVSVAVAKPGVLPKVPVCVLGLAGRVRRSALSGWLKQPFVILFLNDLANLRRLDLDYRSFW